MLISEDIPFADAAGEHRKRLGVDDRSNEFAGVEAEEAGDVKLGKLRFQLDYGVVLKNLQLGMPLRESQVKWVESFTDSAFRMGSKSGLRYWNCPAARRLEPKQARKFARTTKVTWLDPDSERVRLAS